MNFLKMNNEKQQNRDLFAQAFEASADLIAICTYAELNIVEINETFVKTLEINRSEIIGKSLIDLNIGVDKEFKDFVVKLLQEKHSIQDIEISLVTRKGEKVHCLFSATIAEKTNDLLIMIVLKDISKRTNAERLLRIQRDLSLAVGTVSGHREIIRCLLDYSLRIEGLDSGAVYTVDDSSNNAELMMSVGLYEDFVKALSYLSPISSQTVLLSSGRPIYLSFDENETVEIRNSENPELKAAAIVPIRHENKVIGALCLASHEVAEIPERAKHTIEAISGMIGGVFARAKAEKSLRDREESLRQSEKMQAIGQLAGGIAHDFNNQLMGIIGYSDLLHAALKDDSRLSRYVENLLLAARRSAELTAQLLAFARKGKYLSIPVDINKTVQEVIGLLSHSIDKRIFIRQHLRADPCITLGDPSQLQSAILNLALNARDAMPNGGELIFTTDVIEFFDFRSWDNPPFDLSPGRYISIGVSDTGEGISPTIRTHIFEPFFTTKEHGKGTGMGLAAVFGTVKNHKGAITVDSAPNKGASFRILLPLIETKIEFNVAESKKTVANLSGVRVLVVDDEEVVLNVAREMLAHLGCNISICRNGREAIRTFKRNPNDFDIIILDLIMPEISGKDAIVQFKKINPKILVILSSGYSVGKQINNYLLDGTVQFIQKPFMLDELSKKMEQIMSGSTKRALEK